MIIAIPRSDSTIVLITKLGLLIAFIRVLIAMHVNCVLLSWILVTCAILCGSHGNIVMMLKIIVSSVYFHNRSRY